MGAGQLDRKVQFRKRVPPTNTPDVLRGGFTDHGLPQWAHYADGRGQEISIGDLTLNGRGGVLTVRDSATMRALTSDHRVVIDGEEFEVRPFILPVRPGGLLNIPVTSAFSRALFAHEVDKRGEEITVRRLSPLTNITARAFVTGYLPEELVGGVNQGDRKVIVSAEDLEAKGFPLPLKPGVDKVMVRGRLMSIEDVDDSTLRVAGELIAYRLRVRG
jgi:hypothetical protein